jgi:UDP-N-acetyl-D-mannosaminuronic acid dehydrogenase
MKVCMMGLGYIGFPTACVIANAGHEVVGVDTNEELVNRLTQGGIHIVNEDGLGTLVQSVRESGRLRFSTTAVPADVFIIAVPTPFRSGQEHSTLRQELERPEAEYFSDLVYVASAASAVAPFLRPGNLVVLESTVPPRTTEHVVVQSLTQAGVDVSSILLAHAPERVLPGNIIYELIHNNRIVGGLTPEATEAAIAFYSSFVEGKIASTDATTAELVKLMENTFRDVNIALANEFAVVCEHVGVDVWEAIRLANLHPRVNYLRPGPGVGGHCIAVDPYFVVEVAPGLTPLIQAARRVNRRMPLHVLELYRELTRGTVVHKVAVLGASYKADVGDDRESPGIEVAQLLAETGVEVSIHDPYVDRYNQPIEDALSGADAVLLLTDHRVYQDINPTTVADVVAQRLLLDARGHLNVAAWRASGFRVVQLGSGLRKEVAPLA